MRMGELTAVILEQLVVATVVLLLIPVMLVMVGVLRSIPLAQWRVSLALLCATALPVPSSLIQIIRPSTPMSSDSANFRNFRDN